MLVRNLSACDRDMMASSKGNIFHVTGPLCGEWIHRSTVDSPHKDQCRGAVKVLWSAPWINDWVSNREAGDLRRHRAYYDVLVMKYRGHVWDCFIWLCYEFSIYVKIWLCNSTLCKRRFLMPSPACILKISIYVANLVWFCRSTHTPLYNLAASPCFWRQFSLSSFD